MAERACCAIEPLCVDTMKSDPTERPRYPESVFLRAGPPERAFLVHKGRAEFLALSHAIAFPPPVLSVPTLIDASGQRPRGLGTGSCFPLSEVWLE